MRVSVLSWSLPTCQNKHPSGLLPLRSGWTVYHPLQALYGVWYGVLQTRMLLLWVMTPLVVVPHRDKHPLFPVQQTARLASPPFITQANASSSAPAFGIQAAAIRCSAYTQPRLARPLCTPRHLGNSSSKFDLKNFGSNFDAIPNYSSQRRSSGESG